MLNKKLTALVVLGLLLSAAAAGTAEQPPLAQGEKVRLLLVDETKTFSSTMRVGILAGILKKSGLFEVDVKMVEVDSSYADPLVGCTPPDRPYAIILIVPRGIDNRSIDQVWIVTRGFVELPPPVIGAIDALDGILGNVFAGSAIPTDVNDDLYLDFFSALYVVEGWL